MNVTEFRKDISKHLDAALRGEKVTIERGGVTYAVNAYIDEYGNLPANLPMPKVDGVKFQSTPKENNPFHAANESLNSAKVPTNRPVGIFENKQGKTMFDKDIQFCKHGNVKGTCKLGCK